MRKIKAGLYESEDGRYEYRRLHSKKWEARNKETGVSIEGPSLKDVSERFTARVLILRTNDANGQSYGGFQWPRKAGAVATAPDWNPRKECGGGLHGALWGEGNGSLFRWSADAEWMVFSAPFGDVVDLGGKVKVPAARVEAIGNREKVTAWLSDKRPGAIIGAIVTSGYKGTSTSGYKGTSTSGDAGTSTSGYEGTSTSGDGGTSTSGYKGTSTSGNYGTSTSGYKGTSTSGNRGTSTSGYGGTSTSGNYGTSTSGDGGTSTSGEKGIVVVRWWDSGASHYRLAVGYVGEDGIKPNTPYIVRDGKLVEK